MFRKSVAISMAGLMIVASVAFAQQARTFTTGRIAISHDGNNNDNDDIGALGVNWGILASFGVQKRMVHFEHSDNLCPNVAGQYADMIISATGWKYFAGFDSSIVFDCTKQLTQCLANFKKQAELSTADNRLFYICSGPMEIPWRNINNVAKASRKFITCISHSSWNDNFNNSGCGMGHTWNQMKSDFGADGVVFTHISDQNAGLGGGSNFSFLSSMPTNTSIPQSAWTWVKSRDKKNGDVSDAGMTWYLMTGMQNGKPADLEQRFKSPLPPIDGTPVADPSATTSKGMSVSTVVHQQGSIVKVAARGLNGIGLVTIYNLQSRLVARGTMTNGHAAIALRSPLSGTYVVNIASIGQTMTQKILLK